MATMNEEQTRILEFLKHHNAIVTGAGGTGKSYLLRELKKWADARRTVVTAVTSLTGAAALVLDIQGATTLHRFAGIGLGGDSARVIVARLLKKPMAAEKWRKTDIVVIDEISMLSQKLFELIDDVARGVRNRPNEPFGGMHVVGFGDFYQLAPVGDRRASCTDEYGNPVTDPSGKFCFQSPRWLTTFPVHAHFTLTTMVRQKDDLEFQKVLSEIRVGKCSDASAAFLRDRIRAREPGAPAVMKLFPTNAFVDQENQRAYALVKGPEHVFAAETYTTLRKWMNEPAGFSKRDYIKVARAAKESRATELGYLLKDSPCSEQLRLKVGTAVFLLCNLDVENGLANGSQGVVVRFQEMVVAPVEDEEYDADGGGSVFGDDNDDADYDDGYTEEEKKKKKKDAKNGGDKGDKKGAADKKAVPLSTQTPLATTMMMPVVRFHNGQERLIEPHWWQSPSLPCVGVRQIPLKHGWASSIHKSQGATYDEAEVDIGSNVFTPAQAYVALSRLRTSNGLYIISFDRTKIRAHPAVVAFYAMLAAAAAASGAAASGAAASGAAASGAAASGTSAPAPVAASSASSVPKKRVLSPLPTFPVKRQRAATIWGDEDDEE